MNSRILERTKVVVGAVPVDTTGAAVAGDYVALKQYQRLLVVVAQGAWAGGTPAVTLKQATDAAGTGEKALSFTQYYQGTALTDDVYAATTVSSDTFNLPATANTVTLIEVHQQDLDTDNDFAYVRVGVASPGANADLISVVYFLCDPVWEAKPESLPSAIA